LSRSEKSEQTYQKILAVSAKLFREQGYEKTSIQDILNKLAMSKGAVYHHFKSKKEILDAIEENTYQENMRFLRKLVKESTGANALEKMRQVFMKYISAYDFGERNKENLTAHLDPHIMISDIRLQPEHTSYFIGLIEEGIADGSIQTEHPTEVMEVFFMLFSTWLNPILFPRSLEEMRKRMFYLQLLMKNMGLDFIEDAMIERVIREYEKGGYSD